MFIYKATGKLLPNSGYPKTTYLKNLRALIQINSTSRVQSE